MSRPFSEMSTPSISWPERARLRARRQDEKNEAAARAASGQAAFKPFTVLTNPEIVHRQVASVNGVVDDQGLTALQVQANLCEGLYNGLADALCESGAEAEQINTGKVSVECFAARTRAVVRAEERKKSAEERAKSVSKIAEVADIVRSKKSQQAGARVAEAGLTDQERREEVGGSSSSAAVGAPSATESIPPTVTRASLSSTSQSNLKSSSNTEQKDVKSSTVPTPVVKQADPGQEAASAAASELDSTVKEVMERPELGKVINKLREETRKEMLERTLPKVLQVLNDLLSKSRGSMDPSGRYAKLAELFAHRLAETDSWRIYIPASCRVMIAQIFHDLHGHFAPRRTHAAIRGANLWWPKMCKYISDYCKGCVACQVAATPRGEGPGHLFKTDVPQQRWDRIAGDPVPHLPRTERGYDAILLLVCLLTRSVIAVPTHTNASAKELAFLVLSVLVGPHGLPREFCTDRDPKWMSAVLQELFEMLQIQHIATVACHQRADPAERFVQTATRILRTHCYNRPNNWDRYLPMTVLAMNTTWNRVLGMTPEEADKGYNSRLVQLPEFPGASMRDADFKELIAHQRDTQEWIRDLTDDGSADNKEIYDAAHQHQEFAMGDRVMLRMGTRHGLGDKFSARWLGPFTVTKLHTRHGMPVSNYTLDLPASMSRMSTVFHASFLKRYHEQVPGQESLSRPGPVEGAQFEDEFEVESIVKHKWDNRNKRRVYLVKWEGWPDTFNEWIGADKFVSREVINDFCRAAKLDIPAD